MTHLSFSAESADIYEMGAAIRRGLLVGAAVLALAIPSTAGFGRLGEPRPLDISNSEAAQQQTYATHFADFGHENPSPDVRYVANWIARSRDALETDFIIVDKKFAKIYVFDSEARLRASTPVLLGSAVGDDTVPDISTRPIAEVLPEERTTPAGRFLAERGHNTMGEDVIWVDYSAAVSMHRVRTTNPDERRLERLATPTIDDNRISYGCINVPVRFYEEYLRPVFAAQRAFVYVLPESKSVHQVFGSYHASVAQGYRSKQSTTSAAPGAE